MARNLSFKFCTFVLLLFLISSALITVESWDAELCALISQFSLIRLHPASLSISTASPPAVTWHQPKLQLDGDHRHSNLEKLLMSLMNLWMGSESKHAETEDKDLTIDAIVLFGVVSWMSCRFCWRCWFSVCVCVWVWVKTTISTNYIWEWCVMYTHKEKILDDVG